MNEFLEISIVIFLATLLGFVARFLKQPLVITYIITGIVAGPALLNVLHSEDIIHLFSKIGVAILLFIVGLGLNPKALREVGKVALVTGFGQIIFNGLIGLAIALWLGIPLVPALYVAVGLAFSSTIIILKLLSDKGDTHKLYGKIAVGFLLVQDIVASLVLLGIATFSEPTGQSIPITAALTLGKGALLGVGLYFATKHLVRPITRYAAQSQELLYLFSISWGLGLAALFTVAGFSIEIGALAAGVTLAGTPYATEIGSRLRPLRDFFILLFFVLLGAEMNLATTIEVAPQALIFSLFVMIGNPLVTMFLMKRLGYHKKTIFQAGTTVGQISEFSLILAALGLTVNHISQPVVSLITLVGLITIAGSTYTMLYSEKLYPRVERYLGIFQSKRHRAEPSDADQFDAVLFGYNRVGHDFVRSLRSQGLRPLAVDYDPVAVQRLERHGVAHRYGDAGDVEFLSELALHKKKMVVSTLDDFDSNVLIVRAARGGGSRNIVIALADTPHQALELYKQGATYVLMPHLLGAEYATGLIAQHGLHHDSYEEHQIEHIAQLEQRLDDSLIGSFVADLKPELRHAKSPK